MPAIKQEVQMSSFGLKILALILMFIDHIAQFLPEMPIWLHWIGRLAAPVFIYCSIWSFTYTTDRKKYFLRLYLAGVVIVAQLSRQKSKIFIMN